MLQKKYYHGHEDKYYGKKGYYGQVSAFITAYETLFVKIEFSYRGVVHKKFTLNFRADFLLWGLSTALMTNLTVKTRSDYLFYLFRMFRKVRIR